MANPGQLLNSDNAADATQIHIGEFTEDIVDTESLVMVLVPSFSKRDEWGPCRWMPKIDNAGMVIYPREGDKCVVALAATEERGTDEIWVIAY